MREKEVKEGEFRKEIIQENFPELSDKNLHIERVQWLQKDLPQGKSYEISEYRE